MSKPVKSISTPIRLEYTYSVMERIRMSGLGGDAMLAGQRNLTDDRFRGRVEGVQIEFAVAVGAKDDRLAARRHSKR